MINCITNLYLWKYIKENIMNFNELALKMHEENHGKISVISKVKIENRDDLSTAYTPGVAERSEERR